MKILTNNKLLMACTVIAIFASFFFSCQKDLNTPITEDAVSSKFEFKLSLDEVKANFNESPKIPPVGNSGFLNPVTFSKPQPTWANSRRRNIRNQEFYETPLTFEKNVIFTYDSANPNPSTDNKDLWQYVSLVSTKNEAGIIESKYVYFVPETNYWKKNKVKLIGMNFGRIPTDYSGNVFSYNLNGTFSTGWYYEKGVFKGEISKPESGTLRARLYCFENCYPWYYKVSWGGHTSEWYLGGMECSNFCFEAVPSGGGGFSDYTFGSLGSSGSGGTSSTTTVAPIPPLLRGKCITPSVKLCGNSLRVAPDGSVYMKDFALGVTPVSTPGVVTKLLTHQIQAAEITTNTPFDLRFFQRNAISETFNQIIVDAQEYVKNNNITQDGLNRNSRVFPFGNGFGTLGDYIQENFDAWYGLYLNIDAGLPFGSVIYRATIVRQKFGDGNPNSPEIPAKYNPVVASDTECN